VAEGDGALGEGMQSLPVGDAPDSCPAPHHAAGLGTSECLPETLGPVGAVVPGIILGRDCGVRHGLVA